MVRESVMAFVSGAIRVISCIVLILGVVAIGLGMWTIYRGEGPLVDYLKTDRQRQEQKANVPFYETIDKSSGVAEAEMTIQILGGLLVGAGVVLIIDFVLGMFASTRFLAGCCVPSFLAFAVVSSIIFAGCGIASLTILEPLLRTALSAVFENDLDSRVNGNLIENGPLANAEKAFNCCGPQACTEYNTADLERKFVYIQDYCPECETTQGCVDAVLNSYIMHYRLAFAIGCFSISGITALMFLFSLILCCCSD